jgi:phasin family protein
MSQAQPEFVDLYRAGLKSSVELLRASLEGVERLQNQHLAAIRSALEEQSKSSGELGEVKTLDQLMALQSKMAGAQLERVVGYWTGLFQAAGQNQMAAIGQMQNQMAQARDWLSETYAMTARATEEAAKMAAVATSGAGIRQGGKADRKSA